MLITTGFGHPISWHEDNIIPKGHQMSMKDALHIISRESRFKIILPDWSLNLTKELQKVKVAYEELQVQKVAPNLGPLVKEHKCHPLQMYMSEMIKERQNSEEVERYDLFSNLLAANDEDADLINLTESELIGMFNFQIDYSLKFE